MEAAAGELHRSLVIQQALQEQQEQTAEFEDAERQQDALDDLLLERELRSKAGMVYFRRNFETGALEVAHPPHPFNRTLNRQFHIKKNLDWRIESGIPTEFDTEDAHIDYEETLRAAQGFRPDYTRLTLLVDQQEREARVAMEKNSSSLRLGTISEVWEQERRRLDEDAELRQQEAALFTEEYWNEMEDRLGEEIPEVMRIKTFNQGGPDASAKNGWRYGDGHYPYNPSPFAKCVDGRHLNEEQQASLQKTAEEARRAAGLQPGLGKHSST
jgi:hypothetical protein